MEHLVTLSSMDQIKKSFGEFPEVALADGAHATGPNIEGMEDRDIDFYSHIGSPKTDGPNPALREDPTEPVEESEKGRLARNPQTKKFDISVFVYDEEKNVWYCPQGRRGKGARAGRAVVAKTENHRHRAGGYEIKGIGLPSSSASRKP